MKTILVVTSIALFAACGGGNHDGMSDLAAGGGNHDGMSDLAASCEYPQQTPPDGGNDPHCPDRYGGSMGSLCFNQPCSAPALTCRYYGVGDGRPGCYAIAVMWCASTMDRDAGTDGGTAWTCAQ